TAPPAERARVGYLKGRIYEDLSEKEKAIDTYQARVLRRRVVRNTRAWRTGGFTWPGPRPPTAPRCGTSR
ncbi:MAG TPA: hypothetical protein PLL11_15105, partial [Spirochaetota bacterium]|nr:hypothetical protein [Spirochaetota bacterium]